MQNPGSGTSSEKIPFNIHGIRRNAAHFRKLMLIFPFIHPATLHSVIVEHMFNWDVIMQVLFRKHTTASNNYWQNVNEQRLAEEALHEPDVQQMWNKTYEMEVQEKMRPQVNVGIEPTDEEFPQRVTWTLQDGNRWVVAQNRSEHCRSLEQKGQEWIEQYVQNYQTVAQTDECDWIDVCNGVPEQPQFPEPITVYCIRNGENNWMNSGPMDQIFIREEAQDQRVCFNVDVPVTQQSNMCYKGQNRIRKYMGKSVKEIKQEMQEMHRRIAVDILKRNLLPRGRNLINPKFKKTAKKPTRVRKISRMAKNKTETKLNEGEIQEVPGSLISRKGKANSKTRLKASKQKVDAKEKQNFRCVK